MLPCPQNNFFDHVGGLPHQVKKKADWVLYESPDGVVHNSRPGFRSLYPNEEGDSVWTRLDLNSEETELLAEFFFTNGTSVTLQFRRVLACP